jgi:uncharacterized coiled-coil DUF342 family protein
MTRKKSNGNEQSLEAQAAQHNAGMRKDIMRECAESMRGIKAQRSELNEQAGDIRKRLRDCAINVKAWEAMLRLADLDDDTARNDYIDGLREAHDALMPGQTGDLFTPMEAAEKSEPDYLAEPAESA